ncbi:MAG: SDR family NAD(P)-dependent oxidoreductase, partial [Kangiellaceae bacterium]|nr:SDR family NAD(P)-dependent oxidoreductase [Kangiellaceae bacterium]
FIKQMDVTLAGQAVIQLNHLIDKMEGVDLIVINKIKKTINHELDWKIEQQTIDTNISGFTALAMTATNYFIKQQGGHLVAISSINALRGSDLAPAYAASKAYISSYMQGLRKKAAKLKLPVYFTDVKPGFIDTDMAKGKGLFWVAPPNKAAAQIVKAISQKRRDVYITKRWRLVAWLIKWLPEWLYHKL